MKKKINDRSFVRNNKADFRESLRAWLLKTDPYGFERLVKLLLEAMNYKNVQVTAPSRDGGVDVVADIECGLTSVREVVQVKRHRRPIQRKDLDALRGSLYRFGTFRGMLITTSSFTRGTREAASAPGAFPITLINGDKLVDLLIEHNIGVSRCAVELLVFDPSAFSREATDDRGSLSVISAAQAAGRR
jgi:restriction system protein